MNFKKKDLITTAAVAVVLVVSIAMKAPGDSIEDRTLERMPKGSIVAWSPQYAGSSECPRGWKIADGTDNTPDLRGKFLMGTNTGDADSGDPKRLGKSVGHDGGDYAFYDIPSYSVVYIVKQ